MLDAILFDCGNVLLDADPRHLYRQLFENEAAVERFLAEILPKKVRSTWHSGAFVETETMRLAERYPEFRTEILAFFNRYIETIGGVIPGMEDLVYRLKGSGLRLYLLSNWGRDTFPPVRQKFPLFNAFDDMIISGDVGIKKPDPQIFQLATRVFGLTPAKTLFVDDQEKNTRAAAALGFPTELFTSAENLSTTIEHLRRAG